MSMACDPPHPPLRHHLLSADIGCRRHQLCDWIIDMKTNGDLLRADAERSGIPLTSIWKAQEGLAIAKRTKADVALARIMLRHGRLTDEARKYIAREYPQCAS